MMRGTVIFLIFCLILICCGSSAGAVSNTRADSSGADGGDLYLTLGEYLKSIREYKSSLKTYEKAKDLDGLSRTLEGLALAYEKLGDFRQAADYYLRNIDVKQQLGDKKGVAASFNSLGLMAGVQGRNREALSFRRGALQLYEEIGDRAGAAEARYGMGSIYSYLDDCPEALRHFDAAYAMARDLGDVDLLGRVVNAMRSVYASEGRLDLAENLSKRYLERARASKVKSEIALALMSLASVRIELGELEAARSNLQEALALLPTRGQDPIRARVLYEFAQAGGSEASRIEHVEGALTLAEESSMEDLKWKCLTELGELYLARGDTAKSYFLQHRAVVSVESLRRLAGSDELQRHVLKPVRLPYERIVSLILKKQARESDVKEAFSYTERSRAQELAALLRETMNRVGTNGNDRLLGRERDILSRLAFYQAGLQSDTVSSEERAGLLEKIEALEQRFVSLSISLERGDKLYVEALYPKVEQPDELLSTLAADERVLSYFLGDSGSYLFCGKDKVLDVHELPPKDFIEQKISYLLSLIGQGAEKRVLDLASSELFKILLGPAAKELTPGEKIIIIPDGPIKRVPFALLKQGGRYLVEEHDISYVPSLRTLRYLRERNGVRGQSTRLPEYSMIAVGASGEGAAPNRDTSGAGPAVGNGTSREGAAHGSAASRVYPLTAIPAEPLPRAADEAKEMASLFSRTRVLMGRSAEESVFRGSPLDDTGILHFAACTYIDDDEFRRSFIVLNPERNFDDSLVSSSEDGLLQWYEIAALKLNTALVTLSACRPVGRAVGSGEGIAGLTQTLLYAGGGCIVAEQGDVPDEFVGPMMRAYYRNVRKGLGAAAALSAAQRTALAGTGALAAPAAWGAFVAIGDGTSAPKLSREMTGPMYAALAVLAAAAVIIVFNILKKRRSPFLDIGK